MGSSNTLYVSLKSGLKRVTKIVWRVCAFEIRETICQYDRCEDKLRTALQPLVIPASVLSALLVSLLLLLLLLQKNHVTSPLRKKETKAPDPTFNPSRATDRPSKKRERHSDDFSSVASNPLKSSSKIPLAGRHPRRYSGNRNHHGHLYLSFVSASLAVATTFCNNPRHSSLSCFSFNSPLQLAVN